MVLDFVEKIAPLREQLARYGASLSPGGEAVSASIDPLSNAAALRRAAAAILLRLKTLRAALAKSEEGGKAKGDTAAAAWPGEGGSGLFELMAAAREDSNVPENDGVRDLEDKARNKVRAGALREITAAATSPHLVK